MKQRITVRLEDSVHARLVRKAAEHGHKPSSFVRHLINTATAERGMHMTTGGSEQTRVRFPKTEFGMEVGTKHPELCDDEAETMAKNMMEKAG